MERMNNPVHQRQPEVSIKPEEHTTLPTAARVVDEPGTEEYFDGSNRFIVYPLDAVSENIKNAEALKKSTKAMDAVLEVNNITDERAVYKMPEHCITFKSAAVENMHAENDQAMIEVWKRLGSLLGSLPVNRLPRQLSLNQILLDQDTGEIKFLPSVVMGGGTSIEDLALRLEAEYASSMLDIRQKQKLKILAASLLRSAAASEQDGRQ